MKRVIAIWAFVVLSVPVLAQEWNMESLESHKFRNIGPAGMSGRITCITTHPNNAQIIFAGAASGGLWKSVNNGQTWEALFQNEKVSSVGAVAIDPQHPDIIYVGTGEGNPRNSQTSGYGLYKSYDGGKTWSCIGLEETRTIHRIIIDPNNPSTLYVGATGLAWADSPRGVFKSTDGGKTWEQSLYINDKVGAGDLVMDPNNPQKLIANMWEYRREPWFFKSGGTEGGLYITYDGGENWKQLNSEDNGLPAGPIGRCGLAIAPSASNVVYALIETEKKNGLYRSYNGGEDWHLVSEDNRTGNRPFYYADLRVDPQNANRIYSLWTFVTCSDDGGKTWRTLTPYSSVHPDHHSMWINPQNPAHIIEGNDGGLNISYDYGNSWRFIANLPLAQFYHINVDNQLPYNVYGGMQDNGSWMGPAYSLTVDGIRNNEWEELFFGDGFDVVPHPTDHRWVYAQSQEGNVARIDVETGYNVLIKPHHPEGERLRFHWNAPIAVDPYNADGLYFGSQYLHKSSDRGNSWTIISPDLTTNDPAKQKQLESGGLTYDVTGAENHTCLLAIAPSSLDQNVIWTGSDDGRLHITTDGGATWTDLSGKLKGATPGAWIPQIRASRYNPGEAWVVVNDYRRGDFSPYLYKVTNYGKKVERVVDEKDLFGPVLSVIQDPVSPNLVFLGGEYGLYVSFDGGEHFVQWNKDFPTAQVRDLAIQEREKDLVVGTFGRSAWILDDLEPLRQLAANPELWEKDLTFFAPPAAYHWNRKQNSGIRFAASAEYRGQNKRRSAPLRFYLPNLAEDNKKKMQLVYTNLHGDTVYTQYARVNPGLNTVHWGLVTKGQHYPHFAERKSKPEETDYRGAPAVPGVYTVHASFDGNEATQTIHVNMDPRQQGYLTQADLEAKVADFRRLEAIEKELDDVVQQLAKAQSNLNRIQALTNAHGDQADSALVAELAATFKALEEVRLSLYGKKEIKGYFEQPETWSSTWNSSLWQLLSSGEPWSDNHEILFAQVAKRTAEAVEAVEAFLSGSYKDFIDLWEANALGPVLEL